MRADDKITLTPAPGWPGWVVTPTTHLLVALDDDGDLLVVDERTGTPVIGSLPPLEFLEVATVAAELYVDRYAPTPGRAA